MSLELILVDDDPLNNKINSLIIHRVNPQIEVRSFYDPQKAIEVIMGEKLNSSKLLFLDLNMPVLDGWGFLEQLQQNNIPLNTVILTSSVDKRDQMRAEKYDLVKGFILKPLTKEKLENCLSEL
ncbi:MAG: response regulator [Cyclobacteriaceae bacterium]|nr:response regulator [Cyclobacteriaceae bacterium]MCH8516408.1 response regulator [Cyclobacteriaceae bacterium]